jgi:hypothetical protein
MYCFKSGEGRTFSISINFGSKIPLPSNKLMSNMIVITDVINRIVHED